MGANYYHQLGVLGGYNVTTKQIILDFKGLVGDEYLPNYTLVHEGVHAILGVETEFGHVTNLLYQVQNELIYDKGEVNKILSIMYWNQHFVQEGFATLIPFSILKDKIGKEKADKWAEFNITNTKKTPYKTYLHQLYFVTELDLDKRNKFYTRISSLIMETGFRIIVPQKDLLKSANSLKDYLSQDEYNPNKRLEKSIPVIQANPSILELPINEIANKIGIPYLPADKQNAAKFMTYLSSKTNHPFEYKEEHVKNIPDGKTTLNETYENMVVANINMDLANTSEVVHPKDFLFMSDIMKVIFVHKVNKNTTDITFLKSLTTDSPEIAIVGFIPNREEYITYVSKQTAENIVNNKLTNLTLVVRNEDYDQDSFRLNWSDKLRQPDLVLYSFPKQMQSFMQKTLEIYPTIQFKHLHSQFMENNPLQTLLINIVPHKPIHIVNHFGNKGISDILANLKSRSAIMDRSYIETNRETINNLLAFWMGQHWEVDWVSNMFDKTNLFFRTGQVIPIDSL